MSLPSLVELCFQSVAEHLEYNSEAIKKLPIDLTERLISFLVDKLHPRHLVMSQTRAIKIRLLGQKRCCTFRFLLHGSVGQAIQQIYDKTEDGLGNPVEYYGLFQPSGTFRKARWLREDKTLSYYDIDPSDVLDFKAKKTTIKIKFLGPWEKVVHPLHLSTLDKTVKTFIVDESKTACEIAKDIGRKLGFKHPEEYSLKLTSLNDDAGIWVIPDLTLPEQGVDPLCSTFLLKRQFYFYDEKITYSMDPDALHFQFCQSLDALIAMTHPCTMDEAVLFAALQCQICFCDYHPRNDALDSFRLMEYIPPEYVSHKNITRDIMNNYQKLTGMSEEKAKISYIQLTKQLKSYMYTFFCVEKFTSNKQTKTCLLGISMDTVLVIDADTKETIDRHPFTTIKKWQVLYTFFSLYLPDHKEEYLTCEAETISQVLFSYIHHSLRDSPSLQTRWDNDYASVSRVYSRRKMSTDVDLAESKICLDSGQIIKKCPLYVEPKKMYINPLFGNMAASFPKKYDDMVKANKFVRVIRMLSELSHKMFRTFSSKHSYGQERELHVKFSDKKVKMFVVKEERTVRELANDIGRRLGIVNTEEFSLQLQQQKQQQQDEPAAQADGNSNGGIGSGSGFGIGVGVGSGSGSEGALWLNPNLTLSEQGVPLGAVLLYKKKFYYNDASDDCHNDPVYFNLLFCQSRDAIISNMYACNKEEAIQLAATQFQINFGDHNPTIHKPGFLKPQDLRFFLPPECLEVWNINFQKVEKLIYKEHRKLRGIKEVYAKFRYVQLCRSLKTYGAIFFQVKPPVKEKPHPLLPSTSLLLGFSRKSILILTAKSKKFLLETPLAHLRRWVFDKTTNTFLLDFGDYEEGCFSFYTTEGDAISQYLSDYIDFIQAKIVGSQALTGADDS